jgi:phage shock protein PspC (stress-responsive transcriptional regulator)
MRERLYRSRDDRVLAGVCGGVAEWLDIDPSLVRIVFALLVITGGIGLLLYIVMAIVVPEEPYYVPNAAPPGGPGPVGASAEHGSPAGTPDAAAGVAGGAATAGSAGGTGATSGPTTAGSAPMTGAYPPGAWMTEREARRAARRDARGQRRADHDGRAGLIFGGILVLIGVWFLVRRYIPAFDGDFLGPIILIGIGAIVLAGALRRNEEDGPTKPR